MTALGTLWQPLCERPALGLRLAEKEAVEEEEAEAGGNQLLSLRNNSSLSRPPPIYESWERSPASLTERETKPTHL